MKIGNVAKSFTALGLMDSITKIISTTLPRTHVRKSKQMDGIWTSADLFSAASFTYLTSG